MTRCTTPLLLAVALAAPLTEALADNDDRKCRARNDSVPTSLGATGWAAVDGPVTGGCSAGQKRVFHVRSRSELVGALNHDILLLLDHFLPRVDFRKRHLLDHRPKIIYVHGTIDLNVDHRNRPLVEEDYMRMCNYTAHDTYYDPVTGDQAGSGGFFGAYKTEYDPNRWIRQSLDAADNRPPALSGPLEEARICFQRAQAERVMIDVGSNTSIIGVGTDARIINGGLRIGFMNQFDANDRDNYRAENVVVRNITFADAFDMFPGWDPKDSFSITITNAGGCQAVFDETTDSGPHKCVFRGGRWNTEYDSISVMNAEAVWIDHNSFTDEPRFDTQFPPVFAAPFNEPTQKTAHHDGHVDVTLLATKVTISNNHFLRHDKGNLLGGSDVANLVPGYGPGQIDVTFHGNYYQNMIQRMPRVRFGRVHVYNNVFDGDRRQNAPNAAEYRLGDTWATGTAAKLVTENNLFDIINDTNLTIPRIINYASTVASRDLCVSAGYGAAECGTYYGDTGTWITMRRQNGTNTATTLFDAFTALAGIQDDSASNAPLTKLDPADPAVFWYPTRTYSYALAPVDVPGDLVAAEALRAKFRAGVIANAGAGKL
jgi:pectate lyase